MKKDIYFTVPITACHTVEIPDDMDAEEVASELANSHSFFYDVLWPELEEDLDQAMVEYELHNTSDAPDITAEEVKKYIYERF